MITVLEGVVTLLRFMVGACVFSFTNVVIFRLPRGESVVRGRSRCPACGRTLTARELIPCVSFLVQRGRCFGCKKPISFRYFIGECLGGLALLCCGAWFGYSGRGLLLSPRGLLAFAYLAVLMAVAGIDWDTRVIYDRFHIAIAVLGVAALRLFPEHGLIDRLIGAGAVALPMLGLALCVEGAFGGGDIKLMAASGFLLGWQAILVAMFWGLVSGGVYCVWMMARGRLSRKDRFAFGPFLAAGLAASLFFGDAAAQWYLSVL